MEVVLPPPSRHGRASGMGFTIVGRIPASQLHDIGRPRNKSVHGAMLQGAHLAVTQRLSGQ